jgi:hypothetical protein
MYAVNRAYVKMRSKPDEDEEFIRMRVVCIINCPDLR